MTNDTILMTPDAAMRFLVWTAYYGGLHPEQGKSYSRYMDVPWATTFLQRAGIQRLDRLQEALYKCFEPASVSRSVQQLELARQRGEQCPFTEQELENIFLKL